MEQTNPVSLRDPLSWPKSVRRAVDAIASVIVHSYLLARSRATGNRNRYARLLARASRSLWDARLLRRENRILRRRIKRLQPSKRPHYKGRDRFAILQVMRLRHWNAKRTARRFVLHANTVRAWLNELRHKKNVGIFFGRAPFNKLGASARWTVHQIRELCPEPHIGSRTIAMEVVRAGLKLSRSTVVRVLREAPPPKPAAPARAYRAGPSFNLLRPKEINRVWHLDLTTFEFFWIRFYVAALLDGFSRKLLALRVYRDAPSTDHMLRLVNKATKTHAKPRFLVTDHGCQFRKRFRKAMKRLGIKTARGKAEKEKACRFNGKAERFMKTLKLWQRLTLFAWKIPSIQRQLDTYREWYNAERPMWIHGGRTPEEVWGNIPLAQATPLRAHEPQPVITVRRVDYRDDPELPTIDIQVIRSVQRAA